MNWALWWGINAFVHAIMIAYVPFTLFRMGLVWIGMVLLRLYTLDQQNRHRKQNPE